MIAVGDDAQPFADQILMHIALMFHFLFIAIAFRQSAFHLLDPTVMHFRSINMYAGKG